jgi:hypothetical protein
MRKAPLDATALKMGCLDNHDQMHKRMVQCAKRATAAAGTRHLFIMSHPDIRPRILELFEAVRSCHTGLCKSHVRRGHTRSRGCLTRQLCPITQSILRT